MFDQTTFKHKEPFEFSEVEKLSKDAPTFHKNPKFAPSQGNVLMGMVPQEPFYGTAGAYQM